jgi:hypothetical protein
MLTAQMGIRKLPLDLIRWNYFYCIGYDRAEQVPREVAESLLPAVSPNRRMLHPSASGSVAVRYASRPCVSEVGGPAGRWNHGLVHDAPDGTWRRSRIIRHHEAGGGNQRM